MSKMHFSDYSSEKILIFFHFWKKCLINESQKCQKMHFSDYSSEKILNFGIKSLNFKKLLEEMTVKDKKNWDFFLSFTAISPESLQEM